ncbi:sulfur oxidation c-type cytochrome SoxX [Fretibacter rubidus]|uniref:sulfur oxidation c-type cytochrome SoxX n=1 Tax=Fretibacter rubidus TaxID=570162 RepID=UPI00352B4D74
MRALLAFVVLFLVGCGSDRTVIGDTMPTPLTKTAGDPARGEALFITREQGHCILCHRVTGLSAEFQGNLGPTLDGVADRLSPAQLRLRIVDYDAVVPGATMPSYFRTQGLTQVGQNHAGQTVLSAQDIEDIIAYLTALKTTTPMGGEMQ